MMVIDPAVCARCARLGHPQCLGMERFAGHMFCGRCISNAIAEYSSFRDAHSRENWRRELALQVSTWKARAVQLIGIPSTVGVVVGGAVAAAAGAVAGLAQGAVRGAVGGGINAPCHASTAGRGAGARVACPVATASTALRTTPRNIHLCGPPALTFLRQPSRRGHALLGMLDG